MTLAFPAVAIGYGDHIHINNGLVTNFNQQNINAGVPSSAVWPSASRAIYYPVLLQWPFTLRRFWTLNGATALGNTDIGIYRADGSGGGPSTKIISSGNVAQAGTNVVQYFDVTDTPLVPGLYWVALVSSTATSTFFRIQAAGTGQNFFYASQATASPLPATATPVFPSADNYIACAGFTQRATP